MSTSEQVEKSNELPYWQTGHWTDCINPLNKIPHGFYQYPKFPDNQKICPVCWSQLLRIEDYKRFIPAFRTETSKGEQHKKGRNSYTPEKDTL